MKKVNRLLHIFLSTAALLSAGNAFAISKDTNATFAHYYGEAYAEDQANAFDSKGYQKCPEVHDYYYVDANRSSMALNLPFASYTGSGGDMEPRGWIRWYDYDTDREAVNLTANGSKLKSIFVTEGGKSVSKGFFGYNIGANPNQNNIGVTYVPPTGSESSDWEGETIACDVSRYIDYTSATYPEHEPTLSIRCIFHIQSAAKLADDIMNKAIGHAPASLTYEDGRAIDFGTYATSSTMNLRLNLTSVGSYYFHPMSSSYTSNHHIYYPDGQASTYAINAEHFDNSTVKQATAVEWRVYDSTRSKYAILTYNSTSIFQTLSIDNCNKAIWYDLTGTYTSKPTIAVGNYVYVVAYLVNGTSKCPVANCRVWFKSTYPMLDSERTTGYRSDSYIENNYKKYEVKCIDFDNISSKQTDVAPTSGEDNMAPLPLEMTNCGYGYVYPSLYNKERFGWPDDGNRTPIHGEYNLIKSANLSNISTSSQSYHWWNTGTIMYDRTYIKTGGKQWGYFMYLDASDESRHVVATDFNANLCTGSRLIFEAYVADFTSGNEKPQVLFKLYGIDSKGEAHIIQSFTSGNIGNNTSASSIFGKWFQVYGQVTIGAVDNASKYSKFRLSIDNMCTNTDGADYCVDDVHIYMRNNQVDVVQDVPMCPDEDGTSVLNNIRFKLRTDYESLMELSSDYDKLYYRICKADGTPMKFDYDDDDDVDDYGVIDIPTAYDASAEMGEKDGGPTQKRFEKDQYGNVSLVFANRHFDLEENVKYYVSVSFPDEDGNPTQWGSPNDVCTYYSEIYVIAKQTSTVTDENGKIATDIRIDCNSGSVKTYNITAKIQTVDPVNGGTVTLDGISFDWFCDTDNSTSFNDAEYNGTKLATALNHFRTVYPKATGIQSASGVFISTDREVLQYFIRTVGYLSLDASATMPEFDGFEDNSGTFKVYAIPIATSTTVGGITYEICPTALVYTFHLSKAGPKVTFGFANVTYPADEPNRRLRIGKPQLNALTNGGSLTVDVPVSSITYYDTNHTYTGVEKISAGAVYVTDTNDPSWDMSETHQVAIVTNSGTIKSGDNINLSFSGDDAKNFNEGYWYDLTLTFNAAYQDSYWSSGTVSCPGESTIRFLVVPEYLTWNSFNSTTQNPNWNNDDNWTRSSKEELYKAVYSDYRTDGCYVPMKFSKVVIPVQEGGVYPYLSSILYNAANGIATNLSNIKGEATTYIQYDLMCSWNYDTADGSNDGAGNFDCERFYGNTCDEIYLKPEGEVLHQNYLVYNKAWTDREFKAGKWNLVSSPLKNTYSGDMYVPKANGKQTTEAFKPITYSTALNDRITMPVYQRAWDKSYNEVLADGSTIKAYDYSGTGITLDDGISAASQQWSHSFNDVTYDFGSTGNAGVGGLAVKVGDDYFFNTGGTALMRLPKADTSYTYYAPDGTMRTSTTLEKDSCNRFIVEPKAASTIQFRLAQDNTSNRYFIVGNPYASTISMYQFINANTSLERKVWIMRNGSLTGYSVPDEGDADYKKNDVLITPMTAFIVKLKDGEKPGTVDFNADVIAERWVSGASIVSNINLESLTITATDGDLQSTATVNCSPMASNDYVESEDVEILDSHLDGPMVYTVASDKAVSVNNTDRIEWLPVGVASTNGTVQLTVSRQGISTDLYLYDALTRTSQRIEDGESIEVKGNAHGRYFITDRDMNGSVDTEVADLCTIKCYSPERGLLTVKASQPESMMSVAVYDASGRLMAAVQTDGRLQADFQLTAGVYVVSATLSDGTVRTEKAYVR